MRKSFKTYPVFYKIIALLICFLLVLLYNKSKADDFFSADRTRVKFIQLSKTAVSVKIRSESGNMVELFLFSPGGELEKSIKVDPAKKTLIENLKTGLYLYQCFENDIELNSGKLILK
jgi:hypothetical protein